MRKKKEIIRGVRNCYSGPGTVNGAHPKYWDWIDIENYFNQLWKDVRKNEKKFLEVGRKKIGWSEEEMKKNSEFFLKLKR